MAEFTYRLSGESAPERADICEILWNLCIDAGLRAAVHLPLGESTVQIELGVIDTGIEFASDQLRSIWSPKSLAALIALSALLAVPTGDSGTASTTPSACENSGAAIEPVRAGIPSVNVIRMIQVYIGALSINDVAPSIRHLFQTEPSETARATAFWLIQSIVALGGFPKSIQVEPEGGIEVLLMSPTARLSYSVLNAGFVTVNLLDLNGEQTNWEVALAGDTASFTSIVGESYVRFLKS